jgi:hypothetical protein
MIFSSPPFRVYFDISLERNKKENVPALVINQTQHNLFSSKINEEIIIWRCDIEKGELNESKTRN